MKKLIGLILGLLLVCGLTACGVPGGETQTHEHNWAEATCTSRKTCMTCGAKAGLKLGHIGGEATCVAKATCERCGESYGSLVAHDWTAATCTTPKACKVCYATEGSMLGHTGGTAVCGSTKACDRCGESYGAVVINHSYTLMIRSDKALAEAASCKGPAIYYLSCICGQISYSNTYIFEYGLAHHKDDNLDYKCDDCGKDIPNAPVCQHRDADDNGKCDKCGADYTDGKDLDCAHKFGDWKLYGDNTSVSCDQKLLYRVCSACNTIEWKNGGYDNHSFQTVTYDPTCTAQGYDERTCTVCGLVDKVNYTGLEAHEYKSAYTANASFHWLECKHCDATTGYGEHTADDLGICTVCEEPILPTEGIVYDVSADGTYAEVIGYEGAATKILIADTYNGLPVKNIYQEAFKNMNFITSVVIPDSVETLGAYAFAYCDQLSEITLGESLVSIGNYAFYYCTSLTSVVIPDSVTSIGYAAFAHCHSLTSVVIGDSVETLGENAFAFCGQLSEITLGESLVSIGSSAFYYCTSLTSVVIGDSVTSIGDSAFEYCNSLTSVVIGDSVTSIGEWAFYNCNSLTSVTFENTEGWWVSEDANATSGTEISAEDLANTSTAAYYLRSTYRGYYWFCG